MIETLSRRKLIGGLGLLIAAPAAVRMASLMPVKALPIGKAGNNYIQITGITAIADIDNLNDIIWMIPPRDTPIYSRYYVGCWSCAIICPMGIRGG